MFRATAVVITVIGLSTVGLSGLYWVAGATEAPAGENPVIVPDGFELVYPRMEGRDSLPETFCGGFLCSLEDGRLLNAYHTESGLCVSFSRNGGENWVRPREVATPEPGTTFGRPSAMQTRDGTLWLFTFGFVKWSLDPREADAQMRKRINGGALETSVVELRDGRIWMVVRTVIGYLWESDSNDGGLTWGPLRPTKITCGGPVYVMRLSNNGRIAMVWNEADWTQAERWSGWPNGYAQASIAISDNGYRWHGPVVYAKSISAAWFARNCFTYPRYPEFSSPTRYGTRRMGKRPYGAAGNSFCDGGRWSP